MKVFLIGPMDVSRIALDGNALVSGYPPLTALAGFSDSIARRLHQPAANWPLALLIHDLQVSPGRFKPKPDKSGQPVEAIERITGSLTGTILLVDPGASVTEAEVEAALPGLRLAGGMPPLRTGAREIESLSILSTLPPGHLIVDRSDLLEKAAEQAADPLDGLLDLFTWQPVEGGGWTNPWSLDENGSRRLLAPVAVGYQAIEPLANCQPRQGTRCSNTPHVFAEGIASVAELVSARKLARAKSDEGSALPMFWCWETDAEAGTLRVRGVSLNSLQESTQP